MTRADCVHSTPPLRTPIDTTRRNLIAQAAAAVAGGALLGATLPLPEAAGAAQPLVDPVYAAITRREQISILYTAAVDRSGDMEASHPDYEEAVGITAEVSTALFEQRSKPIFGFRPTTLAGVTALLRYIAKLEAWHIGRARGLEEPDAQDAVQALCASIATAIEQMKVAA